jgi:hypothetical protein
MERGTKRYRRIDLKFAKKRRSSTRNNRKTSAIDCRGYISSFDVILFPKVWSLVSYDRSWFNLKGGLWNRGGSDDEQRRWWWNSGGSYSSFLG